MELELLPYEFAICKVTGLADVNWQSKFVFVGKTDNELSLVCLAQDVPLTAARADTGWRAFRIPETLDFVLVGILAGLTKILADQRISVFAISTFDTDYVLVKSDLVNEATEALVQGGYNVR